MLTLSRLGLITNLQRLTTRAVSSVVPDAKVEEFTVKNEPVLEYLPGSKERKELECALDKMAGQTWEVPIIIGGEKLTTKECRFQVMPHNHQKKLAKFYYASTDIVLKAIKKANEAQKSWDLVPLKERIAIWRKAADLMATKYRMELNAATMLGQAKTVVQAEIDSAAELIDFIRFNAYYASQIVKYAPVSPDPKVTLNSMRYRGLEGFVASVSPFNFTAIGGNLAYTPALMGCSTLWKPSDTALLSNYLIYQVMTEAGVPPGVVNFVPADGPVFGDAITSSPTLAGINFTGSVPTFNRLWTQVGKNVDKYKNYPRLIGECGGKNYHFVHPSADVESVISGTIRSAFEFCGQKCSACSRMYVPESLWPKIKEGLLETRKKLKVGDVRDFDTFMSAVIDDKAYKRIKGYIEMAKKSDCLEVLGGGNCVDKCGYFVEPTIVESKDPLNKIMTEEIFGPVLTIFVYDDSDIEQTLDLVADSTPYALTGAVFAQDLKFQSYALEKLRMVSGNYYINDKSTGSVVAQQPFGGGRMSGTNDKAGGPHYILRWTTPQSIKETFVPLRDIVYPYMKK
ncbi:delta-1-pyrroline-5-carboxylate dehydrogenase, mitochondrial [Cimex lectularius]|uniref:Multifunctional fusion protein n=1 Tax=Cimex lectularius TaxID=79782 RepID=A0A8I6RZZ4_CIMLE|nr:delta-1-pyrroline-5-carboxylate dehydrogenase, mitochondrial [Cimex lectularius]